MSLQASLRRVMPAPVRRQLQTRIPPAVRLRLSPTPAWRIGVGVAPSPLALDAAALRPVFDEDTLARAGLGLVADPFAIRQHGIWFLFFEAVATGQRRGFVGLATSADARRWTYEGPVLEEPFHLSYPAVFAADDEVFMIPESSFDGTLRLYRARAFPTVWELDRILLRGAAYKDASPFQHQGHWYLLVETSRDHTNDELRLLHAPHPRGPWTEHPASPVVTGDAGLARPAGRPVPVGDRLVRFAQDCRRGYGRAVLGIHIEALTPSTYAETPLPAPLLTPAGPLWSAGGMHHLDVHDTPDGWVCFVDGRP
ncbi:hypothetical protein [Egicoccus sp. AB-alg2]|uniref:glucosamine inositolphosphorylceramide transferase family protein n=1 Tax=Egicoccus sp. AB-alg2 TaxID=3242693 RepID=UPI00359E0968